MKKIALAACMCLALSANAQKVEVGIAGGPKLGRDGYVGAVSGYVTLWKLLQVGAVCEVGQINPDITFTHPSSSRIIAPGINVNYKVPIARGYLYPGVAARYTRGRNAIEQDLNGYELGVHAGMVMKIVKSLSVNAEVGLRAQTATMRAHVENFPNSEHMEILPLPQTATYVNIPVMVGLRWAF